MGAEEERGGCAERRLLTNPTGRASTFSWATLLESYKTLNPDRVLFVFRPLGTKASTNVLIFWLLQRLAFPG